MKYLLDTNALIVLGTNFEALRPAVQIILTDEANEFVLSPASLWEMAIKVRLGKLDLNGISLETFATVIRRNFRIHLLPIKQSQAALHCHATESKRPRRPVRPAHYRAGADRKPAGAYVRPKVCRLWSPGDGVALMPLLFL